MRAPDPRGLRWRPLTRAVASLLALAALAMLAPLARSASGVDFDIWMRVVDQRSVSLQRALQRRDAASAAQDAREIERVYAELQTWYERAGQSDEAVKISREGRELAAAIPSALTREDFAGAHDAALRIARACNDCHDGYKPLR